MNESIKSFKITWEITFEDVQDDLKLELSYIKEGLSKLSEALQAREDLLLVKDILTGDHVLLEKYGDNV